MRIHAIQYNNDLIPMAPYAATYWKYYLIIEQPTPICFDVHRWRGLSG